MCVGERDKNQDKTGRSGGLGKRRGNKKEDCGGLFGTNQSKKSEICREGQICKCFQGMQGQNQDV